MRQATYLGGEGYDWPYSLALDAATGDVVIAGLTDSSGLPGAAGGAQSSLSGDDTYGDGFVTRLSGDLKALSPQAITFPQQAGQEFVAGDSFNIDPAASASSGLPVSYASTTPGVCTVVSSTVTMVGPGTCTVVASQGGNAQWEPAQDVAVSLLLTDNVGPVEPK